MNTKTIDFAAPRSDLEASTFLQVAWRLVPLLYPGYRTVNQARGNVKHSA